jgi:hypothetical protein
MHSAGTSVTTRVSDQTTRTAWRPQRAELCWWRDCQNAAAPQSPRWRGRYCTTHIAALETDAERIGGEG